MFLKCWVHGRDWGGSIVGWFELAWEAAEAAGTGVQADGVVEATDWRIGEGAGGSDPHIAGGVGGAGAATVAIEGDRGELSLVICDGVLRLARISEMAGGRLTGRADADAISERGEFEGTWNKQGR